MQGIWLIYSVIVKNKIIKEVQAYTS